MNALLLCVALQVSQSTLGTPLPMAKKTEPLYRVQLKWLLAQMDGPKTVLGASSVVLPVGDWGDITVGYEKDFRPAKRFGGSAGGPTITIVEDDENRQEIRHWRVCLPRVQNNQATLIVELGETNCCYRDLVVQVKETYSSRGVSLTTQPVTQATPAVPPKKEPPHILPLNKAVTIPHPGGFQSWLEIQIQPVEPNEPEGTFWDPNMPIQTYRPFWYEEF